MHSFISSEITDRTHAIKSILATILHKQRWVKIVVKSYFEKKKSEQSFSDTKFMKCYDFPNKKNSFNLISPNYENT